MKKTCIVNFDFMITLKIRWNLIKNWFFKTNRSKEPIRGLFISNARAHARTRCGLSSSRFELQLLRVPFGGWQFVFTEGLSEKNEHLRPQLREINRFFVKMRPLIPKCTSLVRSVSWHLCFVMFFLWELAQG